MSPALMSESAPPISDPYGSSPVGTVVGVVFVEQRASTPLGPRIIHANAEMLRLSGYDASSLIGSPLGLIYDRNKLPGLIENLPVIATASSYYYMDRLLIRAGGTRRLCRWTIRPTNREGETPGLFVLTAEPVMIPSDRAARAGARDSSRVTLATKGSQPTTGAEAESTPVSRGQSPAAPPAPEVSAPSAPVATAPILPVAKAAKMTAPPERDYEQCRSESLSLAVAGVAHDFKNALQTIKMNLELAALATQSLGKAAIHISEATLALGDAETLARQMLAFTRGESTQRRVIRLSDLIERVKLLCSAGTGVQCRLFLREGTRCVEGDPNQIYQVLHNLVINACQAMPNGGTIDIISDNADLAEGNDFGMAAGRYTVVSVRDRGCGIPPHVLPHIFELDFTTKQNGTGVGLASCQAIVTTHGGAIRVASQVGAGSEFLVFLPSTDAVSEPVVQHPAMRPPRERIMPSGSGRILVVEDEPGVARSTLAMLKQLGYVGLHAGTGESAIRLYRDHLETVEPIDAVLIDMTLPGGLSGLEVAKELWSLHPGVRLVATSGYFEDDAVLPAGSPFAGLLPKPYGMDKLSEALEVAVS
jgi:signal transduction histidine kinase/ActR/RegA family two-component response regulator